MTLNVPNILTLLRIGLIPLFVVVFYLPFSWAYPTSAMIFALAALTDWLDGFLARRLNQTSAFGAFLDPVADKLMVVVALVMLVDVHGSLLLVIPAVIIIVREIAISALREWMAAIGQAKTVAVSMIGKVKTALQMIALLFLLYHWPFLGLPTHALGMLLIYVAAGLTLWSMVLYLKAAFRAVDI